MHGQQPPRTTAAQDGFVPADTLPPGDPLPAAPLLITAYAVAWLAIMFYIWSVWRRLSRVEGELAALGRRVAEPERRGGAR
jgi:CcmD family protein